MKVYFAAFEALPFVKTGGLADVVGSLPSYYDKKIEVTTILPFYRFLKEKLMDKVKHLVHLYVKTGILEEECDVYSLRYAGTEYRFIDSPTFFDRNGIYGYEDDAARFAFYGAAVIEMMCRLEEFPDIIHSHDYHTAPLIALCKLGKHHIERVYAIKHVFTIHNLSFQGIYDKQILFDYLDLDREDFDNGTLRFNDGINYMKIGIVLADAVTTVSKSYAREILDPSGGQGLDTVLQYRQDDLYGIVNGIDDSFFNPKSSYVKYPYNSRNVFREKKKNKLFLQQELGLEEGEDIFLVGMVSRLTSQKGIDLLLGGAERMIRQGVEIAILGTGETRYEYALKTLCWKYPGKISYTCGYNEKLAHRMYAGLDMLLMPSLYEPCGLSQLIAMHFGTVPFVRETGGLRDTVEAYNEYTDTGTGFSFGPYNQQDFNHVFDYAYEQYLDYPKRWRKIMRNDMKKDVSFAASAAEYEKVYRKVMNHDEV